MHLIILLNTILVIVQIFVGILTNSLALLSDASHNSVDILTMFISDYAQKLSTKKANKDYSYGLKRAGILASILNSLILGGIATYLTVSAIGRFQNPETIMALPVIFVSILAIIVNGFSAYKLSKNAKDLNIKSVYVNLFFDTMASVGALIGSTILYFVPTLTWIDPLIGLLIAGLLFKGAFEIIVQAVDILLDSVPKNIEIADVKTQILSHNCVNKIVDLHIWSINNQEIVLTSVIQINPECLIHLDKDIDSLKNDLSKTFGISHQTIEARIQATSHQD